MRLLRSLELALAVGTAGLLLLAGFGRPPGFGSGRIEAATLTDGRPPVAGAAPAGAGAAPAAAEPSVPQLLDAAARRHNLPPHLVQALAFWESGWDQHRVSDTGAVGLMQVEPDVASELGPRLLGRRVNLQDPRDNADIGAAILRAYIDDEGGDVWRGVAAYYQGPQSLNTDGPLPDTQAYTTGIQAIADRLDHGQPPA